MGKNNSQRIKELQQSLDLITSNFKKLKQQIDDNKSYLDNISQHSENADTNYTKIEGISQKANSAIASITKTEEGIKTVKEELTQKLNAIEVKKEEIDKFFIKIFGEENEQGNYSGGLKERLDQKEKELNSSLNKQNERYNKLFDKIEKLLPAATSTGLATAFSNQKNSYKRPSRLLAIGFILSLLGFLFVGVLSFEEGNLFGLPDWQKLLSRTPLFLPLIWLATFSSKQYRQSKRLEQEYAHKEVLTRTYQGYKKEFENNDQGQLSNLNKALIVAISKNPSEIMDDGKSEDTPSIWKRFFGNSNPT